MMKLFILCLIFGLTGEAEAQATEDKVITNKLEPLIVQDIYAAISKKPYVLCPYGHASADVYTEERSKIIDDTLITFRVFDQEKQKLAHALEDTLKKKCNVNSNITLEGKVLLDFIGEIIDEVKGAVNVLSPHEKQIAELEAKVDKANVNRQNKIIRPAADIVQLYDMECYKPFIKSWVPIDRITDRCVSEEPSTIEGKLIVLESRLFPNNTDKQRKKGDVARIHDLRLKLNHHDWDRDRYWFGINESWLSAAKTTTTSLTIHAYPWYARSVSLPTVEDSMRRTSFYLGVGQVSQSTVGTKSYSGRAFSTGIGLELTRGFMLTWGPSFYQETIGTNTNYTKTNVWGITLSSEIASELMGEVKQ